MKTSILSRVILTIGLATLASTHTIRTDNSRRSSIDAAAAAGSGGLGGNKQNLKSSLMEVGVMGLSMLPVDENLVKILGYEAILGGITYGIARRSNPEMANRLAGHIVFITGTLMLCKVLNKPLKWIVPTYIFYRAYPELGGPSASEVLSGAPGWISWGFSKATGLTFSSEERKVAIEKFKSGLSDWLAGKK